MRRTGWGTAHDGHAMPIWNANYLAATTSTPQSFRRLLFSLEY